MDTIVHKLIWQLPYARAPFAPWRTAAFLLLGSWLARPLARRVRRATRTSNMIYWMECPGLPCAAVWYADRCRLRLLRRHARRHGTIMPTSAGDGTEAHGHAGYDSGPEFAAVKRSTRAVTTSPCRAMAHGVIVPSRETWSRGRQPDPSIDA